MSPLCPFPFPCVVYTFPRLVPYPTTNYYLKRINATTLNIRLPMKIKIFIVTYNNEEMINRCLNSLYTNINNVSNHEIIINVINNHSNFSMLDEYSSKTDLHVINNEARPDFSTGHLARNWNQCILHGIKDMRNPDCDVLILAQNDCQFLPNFLENIIEYLCVYDYMTFGVGDEVQVITLTSLNKIGMFDERFCNIGYHAEDYFMRAVLLNHEKTSINDHGHNRLHNPIFNNVVFEPPHLPHNAVKNNLQIEYHEDSRIYHQISFSVLISKWGDDVGSQSVFDEAVLSMKNNRCTRIAPKQYMYYPYFESHLTNVSHKYVNHA